MEKRTKKWEHLIGKYFFEIYNLDEELVASFDLIKDVANYLGCKRETINEYFCRQKKDHIKVKKHFVYREINEDYGKADGTRYYF